MSPFEQAAAVYEHEPCARSFADDLKLHLLHGFVFSTPHYFIMGKPVVRGAQTALIVNPGCIFAWPECDCWHIYLMAGDPSPAWQIMPWPLPWFSWERKNELRYYSAERIKRLSLGSASPFHDA